MFARHASLTRHHIGGPVSRGTKTLRIIRQAVAPSHSHFAITYTPHLRQFQSSPRVRSMADKVRFSSGTDETSLTAALQGLLGSAGQGGGGRWTLISSGQGLERSFKFKNFAKTWDFMTAVSLQCKLKNHHPEWSNVYNTTYIRWTTHNPEGLSAKDVELAGICDTLARDFGEVAVEDQDTAQSCNLRQVADRVVSDAGDCCTPKKR
ncbi:pterin 4 alpha carbinolamine dehydratase-domain-containing protein [Astrocystis sublimbata]|nr:pterin 4 alpha carbinolamine dehydratase-domain-containing protein [Astrocystis sublimbata]